MMLSMKAKQEKKLMIGAMVDDVNGIRGLTCVRDYISAAEEADLLDMIDARPWANVQKRAAQYYGPAATTSRRVGLPGWALALAERLQFDGFTREWFDECTVDEVLPGQGIGQRLDSALGYGETVISLNLGAPLVMEFRHNSGKLKLPVLVPARSLLVLTDAARYKWRHGVAARKVDWYDGLEVRRGRHVSVTFRQTRVDMVGTSSVKYA